MNKFFRGGAVAAGTLAATGLLVAGAAVQAGASPVAHAMPGSVSGQAGPGGRSGQVGRGNPEGRSGQVGRGSPGGRSGQVGWGDTATPAHTAARTVAATYTAPRRSLHEGMSGNDVKALQRRLNALKYYSGTADGQFGPNTQEAVWAFQEVQGIGVDGIVGPITGRALVHPRTYAARHPGGGATRVEVNLTRRVLVLYRNHAIALISHVSSAGGYHFCDANGCSIAVTPTGSYHTTTYMPGWVHVPLGEMYNPVFFIGTSYAIHGDTDVPLNPVSHGCVRIPMDIASFFHTMVSSHGTPVYVYR